MSADKVNMSLDEIIKKNKAEKARESVKKGGPYRKLPKKGAVGKAGGARFRGSSIAAKKIVRRSVQQQRQMRQRQQAGNGQLNALTVKRMVDNAVKRAVARSRPTGAMNGRLGRGGAKVPRNIITTSSRLAAISNRSRAIQRTRPVLPATRFVRRGRGFAGQQQALYADDLEEVMPAPAPIRIIRQRIQAPRPAHQQIIEVVEEAPARMNNNRRRNIGGGAQRVMVVRQQPITRVQNSGRIIRRPVQTVTRVVQQAPRQQMQRLVQPVRQQVVYAQPRQNLRIVRQPQIMTQKVVRRVPQQRFRQQQQQQEVLEFVPSRAQKNNQFRQALGLSGQNRQAVRQVDRFEPSSSFLQQRTITRRGRGFGGY